MSKRTLGVSIFAFLNIILGVVLLTLNFISLFLSPLSSRVKEMIYSQPAQFLYGIILGVVSLMCGIALLKLKWWGRVLFIGLAVFSILYGIYAFSYKILFPVKFNTLWLLINSLSILFWSFAIWFFNRISIKEQFKKI